MALQTKIISKKLNHNKYLSILIPICIIILFSIIYHNLLFIVLLPILIIVFIFLKNNESLYYHFIITLFATGAGVYLANYTHRIEMQNHEKEIVNSYLEIGYNNLDYKFEETNAMLSNMSDTNSTYSQFLIHSEKLLPENFINLMDNELFIRNIQPITYDSYMMLCNTLKFYLKNINDKNNDSYKIKTEFIRGYKNILSQLMEITDVEIMYRKDKISEDSLSSAMNKLWKKYYGVEPNLKNQ